MAGITDSSADHREIRTGYTPVTSRWSRARYVEEAPLGPVGTHQVGIIGDAFVPGLQWQDFAVARHDRYGEELQALGEMHRSDRHAAGCSVRALIQCHRGHSGVDGPECPLHLVLGPDKHANLMRPYANPYRTFFRDIPLHPVGKDGLSYCRRGQPLSPSSSHCGNLAGRCWSLTHMCVVVPEARSCSCRVTS